MFERFSEYHKAEEPIEHLKADVFTGFTDMAVKLSKDEVVKRPAEVRKVDFDWTGSEDLASGETLSAVSGTPAAVPTGDANDLSVESPLVSGTKGQITLKKGRTPLTVTADKTTDKLTLTAHGLSNGNRLHMIG